MLYSAAQWLTIWLVGVGLLLLVRPLSHRIAIGVTLAAVVAVGLLAAQTPGDPVEALYNIHQLDRAIDEQIREP